MSKKKNKRIDDGSSKKNSADYYKLHTDAIDKLVNASAENADVEVGSEPKRDPYKIGFLSRVPCWLKALFIKFWFNGAVCFFFYWGLGTYLTHIWDLILVMGVAMGIITDVMVNNLFRFMDSGEHKYDAWMLTPPKKFWTFFVNILYAGAVMLAVVYTYNGINVAINNARGSDPNTVALGVEPILFGVIYLVYDLAVIWLKNLFVWLFRRGKAKRTKNEVVTEAETEEGN